MPINFSTVATSPAPTSISASSLKIGAFAFNKHIADELNSRLRSTAEIIPGSDEQEAIFDFILNGTSHGVIKACAGTGKTHTIIQSILRIMQAGNCSMNAMTYNSFGWRACMKAFRPALDDSKTGRITEEITEERYGKDNLGWNTWLETITGTKKLVDLCMCYLIDGKDSATLDMIADKHNITLNGSSEYVFSLVPLVLAECANETGIMSFSDQVWQTVTKHLPCDTYDLLFVDEAQDTNMMQQEMAMMACPKGRIIICGDVSQAIYGFRGADVDAIPRMQARLAATDRGVQVFPLTVTRRCPKSHVKLAQAIVPEIQAMPDASEGSVLTMDEEVATRGMKPGDLVLCRTNAPLVSVCYSLIRRNVKAVIRGRDVGTGLRQLIDKLKAGDSVKTLLEKLTQYRDKEMSKLARLKERGAAKVQSLEDRCECVIALTDGVNSVSALKQKIDRIFADFDDAGKPKDAVVLGSVHRTKGLEATRVYVLAPSLLPHPMARQPWERVQEANLAYVAATRAKYIKGNEASGVLVFVADKNCDEVPDIYYRGGVQ